MTDIIAALRDEDCFSDALTLLRHEGSGTHYDYALIYMERAIRYALDSGFGNYNEREVLPVLLDIMRRDVKG